ncbi:MAG TPA: helix-hairpin-helix domain-containing protein, partial [Anaerolineales bacterium]
AYPARPAEPPLPSVHPPAPTPQPTVLSPAGEVSAEVAPLAPAAEENEAAQPDDAPSGEDRPDDRPSGEDQPDDLEVIEGIGPRIASILREQGITTFKQLSEAPLERLQEILRTRNLRLADPTTWPEQARLAGQGDWPALTALQDTLKGGRRVSS